MFGIEGKLVSLLPEVNLGYIAIALPALCLAYCFYSIFIYPFYFSPLRKLPTPPADNNPFTGHLIQALSKESQEQQLEWANEYGGFVRFFYPLNFERVLITDPKALQHILVKRAYEFVKPQRVRTYLGMGIGNGLLVAEGDDHRHQRKLLNNALSYGNIKQFVPIFNEVVTTLTDQWKDALSDRHEIEMDVFIPITKATLDIIGLTGFGHRFDTLTSKKQTLLAKAYDIILADMPAWKRVFWYLMPKLALFDRKMMNGLKMSRIATKEIVEMGKLRMEDNKSNTRDILYMMLEHNKKVMETGEGDLWTDRECRDQILTFLAAGHETTSTLLGWLLYTLALHTDVQEKLREEVQTIFKSNPNPSFEEIDKLTYLDCVYREIVRVHPPVTYTVRTNKVDETLPTSTGEEIFLPKGSLCVISPAVINRCVKHWGPDAGEFRPERWLDESSLPKNLNYVCLTFLAGARGCIGSRFSQMETKVFIARLISEFRFRPVEGFRVRKQFHITCRPEPGVKLHISRA
ncbi:uncharacterized protein VTP21DRAFT_10704 [Calcarisporiella thermophila]|uniref:uncharacterized protein n=1 Tax=Calcarisporiella thermophila TaxID=911321 RepID=UPI0037426C59